MLLALLRANFITGSSWQRAIRENALFASAMHFRESYRTDDKSSMHAPRSRITTAAEIAPLILRVGLQNLCVMLFNEKKKECGGVERHDTDVPVNYFQVQRLFHSFSLRFSYFTVAISEF